jgi:hypothetical protein
MRRIGGRAWACGGYGWLLDSLPRPHEGSGPSDAELQALRDAWHLDSRWRESRWQAGILPAGRSGRQQAGAPGPRSTISSPERGSCYLATEPLMTGNVRALRRWLPCAHSCYSIAGAGGACTERNYCSSARLIESLDRSPHRGQTISTVCGARP